MMLALTLLCLNALVYQHILAEDWVGLDDKFVKEAKVTTDSAEVGTDSAEVVTVVAEEDAILPCAKPPNGSHTVVWIGPTSKLLAVNDKLTQEEGLIRANWNKFPDVSTLRIKGVQFEDQGIYKCQIISKHPVVKEIFLVVQVPPHIDTQDTESHISVYEGELGVLKCYASGVPPPDFLWYKISDLAKTALKKSGREYHIIPMEESDAGVYECVVSNGVGSTDSRQFTVDYLTYPIFVEPETETVTAQKGQTAVLPCFVQNLGEFEVMWYKGYDLIMLKRKHYSIERLSSTDYSLKIDSVRPGDAGQYSCKIERDERQVKYVFLEVKD